MRTIEPTVPSSLSSSLSPSPPSTRSRHGLTNGEWGAVLSMAAFVLLLTVVGWVLLIGVVAPHRYPISSTQVFGVGLGVTAYTLGMRHAFDADHIAAID